jgi:ABC-type transporter Mla subunit MlaD
MIDKTQRNKRTVFAFVAIPLVLSILVIVLIAIRQNLFEKKHSYFTTLMNSSGVSTQTTVIHKGFEIGRVRNFQLNDAGNISVEFYVLGKYEHLMVKESVILRSTNPVLGKTNLEYIRDPQAKEVLPPGSTLPSSDFATGRALLSKLGVSGSDPISSIIENFNILSSELNKDNNADKGALMRIVNNIADATDNAHSMILQLEEIMGEMSVFTANLNRDGNANAGVVFRAINNVADLTASLNDEMGKVGDLLTATDRLMRNYSDPDSLMIRMVDPDGSVILGPLRDTLNGVTANLNVSLKLLESLADTGPEIGPLVMNLNETLANAKKTLQALNNNPLLRGGISTTTTGVAQPVDRVGELPGDK